MSMFLELVLIVFIVPFCVFCLWVLPFYPVVCCLVALLCLQFKWVFVPDKAISIPFVLYRPIIPGWPSQF